MNKGHNRKKTLTFIEELRQCADRSNTHVLINFRNTETVDVTGGIAILANIEIAIRSATATTRFRCRRSKSNQINQVLKQIGVFTLTKQEFGIKITRTDVLHWQVERGFVSDGEKSEALLKHYDEAFGKRLSGKLYSATTEAMLNTRHHAYPKEQFCNLGHGWWMFTQMKDEALSIVLCDLGQGISRSLPKRTSEHWRAWLSKLNIGDSHSQMINAAIEYGRTRMLARNRGKGFVQIVDIVKLFNERKPKSSRIMIVSNKGVYSLFEESPVLKDFDSSFHGTIIHWKVPKTLVA